ncbi:MULTISPECIES: Clp protease N-terminal domain-containing protein [Rhodococcus]|uniref:Clp protease N-terminal domain-containing protein n=1 Tax=Rhodococcus TaxID=1827 RepID=UPI00295536AA|nr:MULTISPECIES: Clp protease N-terminal domain-containing protein [Rhodococcus]MDV7246375.1 Clp protease N-terminal domain-containing protein [Rhodococcus oxybenzonivorans]MDV7337343.1 Clp protease N-terminal domain-containing protein [Rhodococcus oxybenzonivorans]MDV7348037.1 Clp protease N-terminal domain-containing protein [Rhodococcus oxybenzonivorans]MDV8031626.1 Clp protease N-terminal domain-containing protein [Rhodococcus sp. IEGM 27]
MRVFERFSDQARRAVVLASDAARTHQHDHLGTEHLLAGIHAAGGPAAAALTSWEVTTSRLDTALDEIAPPPDFEETRHIPFTPKAKKVLEQGMRETSLLGHEEIGTEHLLLGLLADTTSTGTQLLTRLASMSAADMRERLQHQLTENPGHRPTHITPIRLTDTEHTLCVTAARVAGQRLDTWMRDRLVAAAHAEQQQ